MYCCITNVILADSGLSPMKLIAMSICQGYSQVSTLATVTLHNVLSAHACEANYIEIIFTYECCTNNNKSASKVNGSIR